MKNLLLLLVCFLLAPLYSNATIHRVNNANVSANFTTFATALAAASSGDTIHLEPTGLTYGSLTISKQVVIIGNGYFLDQNQGLQFNTSSSIIGGIDMYPSGDGSTITGLTINGNIRNWSPKSTNYTISRCHISGIISVINTSAGADNLLFDACYFTTPSPLSVSSTIAVEVVFKNCYFESTNITLTSNASGLFTNCILNLTGNLTVSNFQFSNNILIQGSLIDQGGNSYLHNLCNLAQFPATGNNVRLVTMNNSVFLGYPNQGGLSDDARFGLANSSPASGAGIGGTDCGIFGGVGPYKLSGIPAIPTIYEIIAPGSAGNSMQVIISTRVND